MVPMNFPVLTPEAEYLRAAGYVMWDKARLTKEWGFFSGPYEMPDGAEEAEESE